MDMNTIDYYNKNAKEFSASTLDVEFSDRQQKFLSYLDKGDLILDFGCGSGRDSRAFMEQGYQVEAVDGSAELCKLASTHIGQEVKQMLFQELDETEKYNGIWACSSILHLERTELIDVMKRINKALKPEGYLYTSFKYGTFSGIRNGRYFTDMTETGLNELLSEVEGYQVVETNVTSDVRPGREEEKWLNIILKKK